MGSNMQRQAVPLLKTSQPLVGTGMEANVAQDSGSCVLAENDGIIDYVDAERLVVRYDDGVYPDTGGVKHYELQKWHKSNQNSCYGQRPRLPIGTLSRKAMSLLTVPVSKTVSLLSVRTFS